MKITIERKAKPETTSHRQQLPAQLTTWRNAIKLINATVAHLKQYTRPSDQQKTQTPLLEDITFAFQHVEITVTGKTVTSDDSK